MKKELMKLVTVSPEKLKTAKAAINYTENVKGSAEIAVRAFAPFLPVVINEKTGRVLNPVWANACIAARYTEIPCVLVQLPAGSEMIVSMILNGGVEGWLYNIPDDMTPIVPRLRQMMTTNREALLALGGEPDYWQDFFYFLDNPAPALPDDKPGILNPAQLLIDDFDIPRLDLALQPDAIPEDMKAWNSEGRKSPRNRARSFHFYVEDFRFLALAKKPETLIELGAQVAVEPNFSTHEQQPMTAALYDIFQKRKIARQWQDAGVCTIVDMNVTRRYLRLNLMGVPRGWRVYANRAYTADFEHLDLAYEIAREHSGGDDILYMVYGGPRSRELCHERGWHWIDAGTTIDGVGHGQRD